MSTTINPANTLGLDYRRLADGLPWSPKVDGLITDVHVHLGGPPEGNIATFFEAADAYGVQTVWSQTQLEEVDAIRERYGERVRFIAVPNYGAKDKPDTFTTDWLRRIEQFREKGARVAKFWAAPRGRDFHDSFRLDHPTRIEAMKLARSLGMSFMTHVADPDTWFATNYKDASKYGTKMSQYEPLERLLDEFGDVKWLGAHMGGHPEDLEHLQRLLDKHPNYSIDTSATKWMVRELSKHPQRLKSFLAANPGRVLFGTDIVVTAKDAPGNPGAAFDLYASRYWALRTLLETDYDGPSPIVDPDLHLVDPGVSKDATAMLRGAKVGRETLRWVYREAAGNIFSR